MSIELTPAAVGHIKKSLGQRGGGIGIRVSVRKSGCSGHAYTVDYADAAQGGDHRIEVDGVSVLVDEESLPLLDGMRIDYRREGLNAAFRFDNPNVVASCGCGESVTFKQFDPA